MKKMKEMVAMYVSKFIQLVSVKWYLIVIKRVESEEWEQQEEKQKLAILLNIFEFSFILMKDSSKLIKNFSAPQIRSLACERPRKFK